MPPHASGPVAVPPDRATPYPAARGGAALVGRLLSADILPPDDWDALPPDARQAAERELDPTRLLGLLVGHRLLTDYQANRVRDGRAAGLTVGNYRLLDRVACGESGVVYRAEHRRLRTPVAVKLLNPNAAARDSRAAARFAAQARAVAKLRHPNVVAAVDAGDDPPLDPGGLPVPYFVMEFIPGQDLRRAVESCSPLPVSEACHVAHEVADALVEAHRAGLVHRDIKPSNVMVTPDGRVKLLDFGLARAAGGPRLTAPGTRLGDLAYIPPEQGRDAHTVDARADVYGLGATLAFALTGRPPLPGFAAPELPAPLAALLARMLAPDPADRPPTAEAVVRALLPFLPQPSDLTAPVLRPQPAPPPAVTPAPAPAHRVLIVDDQAEIRRLCRLALAPDGVTCDEAGTGPDALARAAEAPYDLVLLDVDLPGFSGREVLARLRQNPPAANLKVLMFSGNATGDDLSRSLLAGADDFVTKPFSVTQLRARVKTALRLKAAQDRTDVLTRQLLAANAELEHTVADRDSELLHARSALVMGMARLVENRSKETGPHLRRLQKFCRALGEAAAGVPAFAAALDPHFIRLLEDCAPLHDIGKAGIPDGVLNKPGPLTPDERLVMQGHTAIGADTLREVARQHPFAVGFLQTAADIARSHHEKWDGTGYPDRLSGEEIPLAARLLAIADVYDALRSRRVYKPGMSHTAAVMTMLESSPGHFDPALLEVFRRIAPTFDQIFRDFPEG